MKRIPAEHTARARAMRNNPTPEEYAMWRVLSRYRPRFTRQLPAGAFTLDIACRTLKLAIELDGSQHADADYEAKDAERTAWLESEGWTVIRFWNSQVWENTQGVGEIILAKAAELSGNTGQGKWIAGGNPSGPQPLPYREGRLRTPRTRKAESNSPPS